MLHRTAINQSFVIDDRQPDLRRVKLQAITINSLILTFFLAVAQDTRAAGVWTPLLNPLPSTGASTMLLLTDGTVMIQSLPKGADGDSATWQKLTPDSSGNYVNGTFSAIARMGTARLFFASNVLPSGNVFVMGGEYSGPNTTQNFINTGEIYDPIADKWNPVTTFPQNQFGDDPSMLLPSGKILCGYLNGTQTYLYDPATNSWTQTGSKLKNDQSDKETWIQLPDGSVLSYDVFASPAKGTGSAQRYYPNSGTWVSTGKVPVPLAGRSGFELGPATLLPNGKVMYVGANNNTVLYTPSTNAWVQGPNLPANVGADDAPGAMLPNGHFLIAAETSTPQLFSGPTKLYDYDYTVNTLTDVTPNNNTDLTPLALSSFLINRAYMYRMLILPNGHLLLCSEQSSTIWDYAPVGIPLTAWLPTIVATPTLNIDGLYTLTGTQLTGISQGATYGDDAEMSTNYPIVRLSTDTGIVHYARTTNWTPGVATGSLQTTVNFAVPKTVPNGQYQLAVIANGIASASQSFNYVSIPSQVVGKYSGGTLTLTGDGNPNSVTVSLQSGLFTVTGSNGTTVVVDPTSGVNGKSVNGVTATFTTPNLIVVDLNDGDDSIAFNRIAANRPHITMNLGNGNDNVTFTLCNVGPCTIDGGPGTDVVLTTSSNFASLTKIDVP